MTNLAVTLVFAKAKCYIIERGVNLKIKDTGSGPS